MGFQWVRYTHLGRCSWPDPELPGDLEQDVPLPASVSASAQQGQSFHPAHDKPCKTSLIVVCNTLSAVDGRCSRGSRITVRHTSHFHGFWGRFCHAGHRVALAWHLQGVLQLRSTQCLPSNLSNPSLSRDRASLRVCLCLHLMKQLRLLTTFFEKHPI